MTDSPYRQQVDGLSMFMIRLDDDISNMGEDAELQKAIELQVAANVHVTATSSSGVVLRIPNDMVLL